MFAKTLFVAFVAAFLASQGCVEARHATKTALQERSFTDIFQKIKQLFEDLIQQAVNQFYQMVEDLMAFAQTVVEDAKQKVFEVVTKIEETINVLVSEAKELGVNVENCVANQKEVFEALVAEAQQDLTACVASKIAEAKDFVTREFNLVQADIDKLEKDWESCSGLFCTPVIVDAGNMLAALPARVKGIYQEAIYLFNKFRVEVPECIMGKAAELLEKAHVMESEIKGCIKEEIQKAKPF